jgi:hypothetical protein
MDRLIALAISIGLCILLLTVIVGFYLGFRIGPPQGLISMLIDSIGKLFCYPLC